MAIRFSSAVLLLLCGLLSAPVLPALGQPGSATRFVDRTYRMYMGKRDKEHPWHNGVDIISKRGFDMVPVEGAVSDAPVSNISTPLGTVGLSADTPFTFQDFHVTYSIPTPWPYCESLSKCLVYSQVSSPARRAPVTLTLPAGVSAVDLYVDAAIDCVTTMRAVVPCKVKVTDAAGSSVAVKVSVSSICASPFVGRYIGFFNEVGEVRSLTLSCKSTFPNAIALVRIGKRRIVNQ